MKVELSHDSEGSSIHSEIEPSCSPLGELKRRLPIVGWLPKYSTNDLQGDIVAGISVAFTIIPQGLAMATLSGLPASTGLYSSFMACFIYALFGTCKDVAIGPTSILAIIIVPYVAIGGVTYAVLLSFFTGLIMILLGLLNLGFLVDFVSFPVMSSFATAAAIVTAASQLKEFFGLKYSAPRFLDTVINFFTHISSIDLNDTIMGVVCVSFLLAVQYSKDFRFKNADSCFVKRFLNSSWWAIVTGRNAIVIFATLLIAMWTESLGAFTLTSEIPPGLPPFALPQFTLNMTNGDSVLVTKDFAGVIGDLGVGSMVLAIISLMEAVAVVKSLSPTHKIDSTQEFFAIGMSNLMGSFVGAYPITGSFSRSAVNNNSGVRTPLGGVVTGGLVLLALGTLAPYFHYIPQTALASTIIAAVIPLIRFTEGMAIYKSKKVDLIPYVATLIFCLAIGLEYGILIGVVLSIGILLKQMARPQISVSKRMTPNGDPFIYVKPDRSICFPSVDYLKTKVKASLPVNLDNNNIDRTVVVIDGEFMTSSDSTFGEVSVSLLANFNQFF